MKLNCKKYREIMENNNLSPETVCYKTGLSEKSFGWILENGFASVDALERLADAAGVDVVEIEAPDKYGEKENSIEFIQGSRRATVTFSQERFKNKIRELAKEYPEECQIIAENKDKTQCAHIPTKWIKIIPPRNLTDEQREEIKARFHPK